MIQCVKQIWKGGKCEYWHSKSITKHKLELLTHLVQKLESLSGCAFHTKRYFCPFFSNGTLGTTVALLEAKLQRFLCRVIFGGFWVQTSTWVLMNRRKSLNPPKIALLGNCRSSASIRANNVPKVPFER